ncbi:MAG: (Fe-S)-binding protein [Actinomycetota bacterium]
MTDMPDPTSTTILGLPGWVLLWAVTTVALVLFALRALRLVAVLRSARREPRWDRPLHRAGLVVVNVLGQRRLLNDRGIGTAHLFIFWTFLFYAGSFVWNLGVGLLRLPIPFADEVGVIVAPMEVLTVIGLVALAGAAVRRYVFTPDRLERSWDATLILILITTLLVTFLLGQGAKALAGEDWAWSPVGGLVGDLLANLGMSPGSGDGFFLWMWWSHMVVVLGFLAYLPYSKHLHLLASPLSVYTATSEPGRLPPGTDGGAQLGDFSWRQLYNGIACAECGRCDRVCPAFGAGTPLSPKEMIHAFRESVVEAATGRSDGKSLIDRIGADAIWACTTCLACMERCPVFNEHVPLIVEMRRHLMAAGEIPGGAQETLMNLARYGNSFGKSPRARARWIGEIDFDLPDARSGPVEYLWFLGDYASFDPRVQGITRATARVFRSVGLDVGILYEAEQNAGNDVRRMGEEGLFEMLRDRNLETMAAAEYRTIVTTDPHSYYTLKHEYSTNGHPVLHVTQVLERLVDAGLIPRSSEPRRVTYHDPCYLGRYDGVFEAPRRIIEALGHDLVEMPRNRTQALCRGAGGGRIWMEDAPSGERPAESRVKEAAALGVGTLVVACPKDLVMFQDAVKTTGLEEDLVIRDVVELVEEAMAAMSRSGGS